MNPRIYPRTVIRAIDAPITRAERTHRARERRARWADFAIFALLVGTLLAGAAYALATDAQSIDVEVTYG